MSDSISKRTVPSGFKPGLRFKDGLAKICVWAPYAALVEIEVNGKSRFSLEKNRHGYWTLSSGAIHPGDRYLYVIDGKTKRPDPASLSQPEGVHEASEAVDLNDLAWSDTSWKNLPLSDFIFYELHTGTFSPEGTFEGITKKLDHLVNLGVTAIEIMPVAQFPGERNWGYDGVYPFAVQYSYGGHAGLSQLVDRCHARGIAVVLDVVYNHMGPEGNYFEDFGPYFTDKYHTPWGNAINFDDAWCDGVRQYFIENALMWFRDFHIDGLRLDAVHAIKDFSPVHILDEIRTRTDELMRETGRQHYLIVELDLNDPRFIRDQAAGGFGMHAQWIDEFHHALRVTAGGETTGYYADFSGIAHLEKAYRDAYVYDGQWSEHRNKNFGKRAAGHPGSQFIVFSQNHDQVGNRMLGERTSMLCSFEMQKLLAGAVLTAPFLPMLFMGEEWSEQNPFLYFVSHTDPQLAEAVRTGRKAEFAAFHKEGEAPDPMADDTFISSRLEWTALDQMPHRVMLKYYKELISIRKRLSPLCNGRRVDMFTAANEADNTLILHRWAGDNHVCCLMNFSKHKRHLTLPAAFHWRKQLDSASPEWGGPGAAADYLEGSEAITLEPESLLIYLAIYV